MVTFMLYLISLGLILAKANLWFIVPQWAIITSWVVFIIFGIIESYAKGVYKGIEFQLREKGMTFEEDE